jgi:hypothetical protein
MFCALKAVVCATHDFEGYGAVVSLGADMWWLRGNIKGIHQQFRQRWRPAPAIKQKNRHFDSAGFF